MSALKEIQPLLITESLAPMDQLHLAMTCKSLLFLAAPVHLGDSIMRQPRQKSTRRSAFCDAYHAGFINMELYDYLLERAGLHSSDFSTVCRAAGRRGDIEMLEMLSRRYKMPICVAAAEGAAEAGHIAFLEWAIGRMPSTTDLEASQIFHVAARKGHKHVLDFLHMRFDMTPRWLVKIVNSAACTGHIDLSLRLYRQLPLCCSEMIFILAADFIAWHAIDKKKKNWKAVLAQFLKPPSIMSDFVGSRAFTVAARRNSVNVLRYVDSKCGFGNNRHLDSALGCAIENGNTAAFDYICQTRPNWKALVDDAIDRPQFLQSNSIGASIALIRRAMPHITKRSSVISLLRTGLHTLMMHESSELLDYAADEFRRRFESPSQDDLKILYLDTYELESIKALARHFPPQSTAHANAIVRNSSEPVETMEFLRQFCPDIDSEIEVWSDQ